MWMRLVELAAQRMQEVRRPQDEVARGLAMLYGAMLNCRAAFLHFKQQQTDRAFSGFAFSIDGLISTLHNLNPSLGLLDAKLVDLLQDYALGDTRTTLLNRPHELVRLQIKILRAVVDEEFASSDIDAEILGEFDDALVHLTELIRAQFTLDEFMQPPTRSTADSRERHAGTFVRSHDSLSP